MIGIYKITSPSKKIYIGQSISLEKRLDSYRRMQCKTQTILYNSFLKYGFEKHKVEIVCECEISELNDKERYYQDLYSVVGGKGMNCRLTKSSDRSGEHSKETKEKMSIAATGRKHSLEFKIRNSELKKGNTYRLGKKLTDEQKQKISKANLGKKLSQETKNKMSAYRKLNPHSKERILKIALSNTGKKRNYTIEQKEAFKMSGSKIILNVENGIFYYGLRDASVALNYKRTTLSHKLVGRLVNNTPLIYV